MSRVAIIGAGPRGLSQLRAHAQAKAGGADIPKLVCFERQSNSPAPMSIMSSMNRVPSTIAGQKKVVFCWPSTGNGLRIRNDSYAVS